MRLTISTNFPDIARKLEQLRADIRDTVAARAVTRVADQGKTQMARQITADYKVLSRDVRERLSVRRATKTAGLSGVEAILKADGKRSVNIIRFSARQTAAGVAISVRKGARKTLTGSFIGNKGRTVFHRLPGTTMQRRSKYSGTKHAQKIAPVTTIFVPSMFNERRINAAVVQAIMDKFPDAFEHEVRYAERKFGVK